MELMEVAGNIKDLDHHCEYKLNINALNQRSANFFYKGPISKYFWFLDQTVSVATTPLCPCSLKAATDDMQMNGHG